MKSGRIARLQSIKNDSSAILMSGKRFVMRADEKLTAFVEVESAIPRLSIGEHNHQDANRQRKESEDSARDHARVRPCKTLTGINKGTFGKRIDGARMRTTIKNACSAILSAGRGGLSLVTRGG